MNKSRSAIYTYLTIAVVYSFADKKCTDEDCFIYPFPKICYQYCIKSVYINSSDLSPNKINGLSNETARKINLIYQKVDNKDIGVDIFNHINSEQDLMRIYGEVSNPNDTRSKNK